MLYGARLAPFQKLESRKIGSSHSKMFLKISFSEKNTNLLKKKQKGNVFSKVGRWWPITLLEMISPTGVF